MAKNLESLKTCSVTNFKISRCSNAPSRIVRGLMSKFPDGERRRNAQLQNESLEFVGDSVLGLAVAEQLYLRHPKRSEGDLTLDEASSGQHGTLAKIAKNLNLGEFMRVGRGEEKTGGRRKQALLADTLEAVIAAIFFDSGYISARAFVNRIFAEEFRSATPKTSIDYKTLLQETCRRKTFRADLQVVIKTEGPPHERTFFVEAVWETGKVSGKGQIR
jgi:ribonuclease-3